jgi:hypothetical protein
MANSEDRIEANSETSREMEIIDPHYSLDLL